MTKLRISNLDKDTAERVGAWRFGCYNERNRLRTGILAAIRKTAQYEQEGDDGNELKWSLRAEEYARELRVHIEDHGV